MKEKYKLCPIKERVDKMIEIFIKDDEDNFSLIFNDGSNEALSTAFFTAYVLTRGKQIEDIISNKSRSYRESYTKKMKDIQKAYSSSIDKLLIKAASVGTPTDAEVACYVLNRIKLKVESDVIYIAWLLGVYFGKLRNESEAS